ncbi:MAG: hypothetical protein WBB23_26275 [Desulforhopalus sp.]
MKRSFLQKPTRTMMYIVILGLALTVLTGCGIGHGPYRHGYNGYNDMRNGGDYRPNVPYGTMYGPGGRSDHRHVPNHGYGGSAYCGW